MDKHIPLLTRMIEVADHYALIDQVVEVLNQQMMCKSDPQASQTLFSRLVPVFSLLGVGFVLHQLSA